jgi:hypothetical protein
VRTLGIIALSAVGLIFSLCVGSYLVYRQYPELTVFEPYRVSVDRMLGEEFVKKSPLYKTITDSVLRNTDAYIFRPARIVPNPDRYGKLDAYLVYGVLQSWEPEDKLVTLTSYAGGLLWVRFDPEQYGTFAVYPALDNYGVIQDMNMRFVSSSADPLWDTQFCAGDVLAVYADSPSAFRASSAFSPMIPARIELSFRLCDR